MAAGLGFKDFVTGEVLTAADVDGYLMQGVWVFASAAARDAAVTSPQEGNFAYLKDTNVTTYYTGSAWANLDTTGMTNPMTTTGDTIYSSSGSTPARLGIGTANQQLRVNASATAPEWFTPSAGGGGKVLQVVSATITTEKDIATTTLTDTNITATITPTASNSKVLVLISQNAFLQASGVERAIGAKLFRDATSLLDYGNYGFQSVYIAGTTFFQSTISGSISYLDSPATTSATTYKVQAKIDGTGASGTSSWQYDSSPSTITLLEIGA
jgi:hypothetical protein